jgi:solute carrier family 25 (mitochondrial carnitine/acylcarnitine transporter), member 20/29
MSADFWASYLSGAVGIAVGNPLDIIKVQLQAGRREIVQLPSAKNSTSKALLKGMLVPLRCGFPVF